MIFLPAAQPQIMTLTFAVPLGYTAPAPIENTALVTSATPDPDTSNNSSTVQTPVNTAADIAVTKSVSPATAAVGDTVTFTVTATNNGPNQATGVVITDVLPAGLNLVSFSPSQGSYVASQGTWTVGTLANGASTQLTLVAQVAQSGAITNVATKTAGERARSEHQQRLRHRDHQPVDAAGGRRAAEDGRQSDPRRRRRRHLHGDGDQLRPGQCHRRGRHRPPAGGSRLPVRHAFAGNLRPGHG